MNIIFMGTPDFAVPALQKLIDSKHNIVCVYTAAPKPAGRGQKEKLSQVHELALKHNILVKTPKTLKTEEALAEFKALGADIAVVAAYGLILPRSIVDACKFGCINIHPSLLPRWRGAAPIQRTILAGDRETAAIIMQMDAGLDSGDILAQENFTIPDHFTAQDLHDEMAVKGGNLLLKTLDAIEAGTAKPLQQSDIGLTYASKLSKEEGKIDWSKSAKDILNQVRAFTPWPSAYFEYKGENIKIHEARLAEKAGAAGLVLDNSLSIACGNGAIQITKLQKPGKNKMDAAEFLKGNPIKMGEILG